MNFVCVCCWFLLELIVCKATLDIPLLIVVSFDGFRHDYLTKAPTPNFHRLIEEGVQGKWMKNAFITKTFPNHFTIATGLYEESHGIVGNEMFDPVFNETFHLNNSDPKWWDNGHVLPVWIANQLASSRRHSGSMMWPGAHVKIRNQSAHYNLQYNYTIPWKERVDIALSWLMNESSPANCLFLYFEEPDATGHQYGPDSKEVIKEIIKADNITGYLIKKLEEYNLFKKTNLIILSDHGMSQVTAEHQINMDKIIDSALYKKFGNSPVWNILPEKGHNQYVLEKLRNGSRSHKYTIYQKEEIPEIFHYRNNRRVMPILAVADLGWGFIVENETVSKVGNRD
ncbi:ectonucleotide pyrophosphatase/phosphodiesterase family member 5-like [Centruroides sculpturatus]|uniref:ectonucleotide pyrophosphatase/phosphodiesterase family member 5-like n=1 Tax=Centruroides sculpturatus TaxID=218467 RepID=UPI000C6DBF63|nr:ectonucleotide pyrophosphatase/phosphodiesterase family member 5-like [Centruroides sculpturatus]